jgi:hypothetical protein
MWIGSGSQAPEWRAYYLACVNGDSKRSPRRKVAMRYRWKIDGLERSRAPWGSLVQNLRLSHSFGFVASFLPSFLQRSGLHFRLRLWPRLVLGFPQRWNRIVASSRFSPFLFVFVWVFFPFFLSAPDLLKRLFFGISHLWCAYFFPLLFLSAVVLFIFLFFFSFTERSNIAFGFRFSLWWPDRSWTKHLLPPGWLDRS